MVGGGVDRQWLIVDPREDMDGEPEGCKELNK
jgi:hypothetical protein